MKKHHRNIQILMAIVLIVSMLIPVSMIGMAGEPVGAAAASLQPALAQVAADTPEAMVRVIVGKADDSGQAERYVQTLGGKVLKDLELIHSFAAQIPAKAAPQLAKLAAVNWVGFDAIMVPAEATINTVGDEFNNASYSDYVVSSFDLADIIIPNTYLYTLGVDYLYAKGITGQGVTVAIIDSGIADHPDFAGRLINTEAYGLGDVYGHGTHVAGIIGGDGSASGGVYRGVAPGVNLISLGVSDEFGMAYESDVVKALQWVHEHKDTYNIRVVNLSLNSTVEDFYHNSGINAAVEILWRNGVVIVASAGNKGPAGGHNTTKTAPANDPFIIVVGASDEKGTTDPSDDVQAAFSSHGITLDGFSRPDIITPGYSIYSTLSPQSSWGNAYPDRVAFDGSYIRLSGTSMAAPMASGAVALLLQYEPDLTPDQVKYRLLNTAASKIDEYPYLNAYFALAYNTTEASNQGIMPHMLLAKMAMIAYWASENDAETIDWENINWDAVNWDSVNWNSVNWNSVNWNSVNWNSVNWNSVNWNSVNWNSVNWNSVNWNSVNWNSVNWNSVNWNAAQLDGIFWEKGEGNGKGPKK